ncbi:LOW QUALITY PROTEIN: Hypothetical protein PHPALM_3079 [Phytophthora palmivora]|uniref:Uncharacterized protein n=1 Tax=Phytophthora palmivora TaxID=4796 RepID=A0A2P4YNB2_9STRA|nr:LOW QUALITY PROTEIN: Hypothetical protein PHPALM_3079 [Phytophthora palmivora]
MRLKGNAVTPVEVSVVAEDGESGQYLHTTYTGSVICGHNSSERASMGARNQYQQHISTNSKQEWALERVYQWMMSGEPNSERLDGEDDVNIGVGESDARMLITKLVRDYRELTTTSSDCPPATALDIQCHIDTGDALPIMLKRHRLAQMDDLVVDDNVTEMLQAGVIEEGDSGAQEGWRGSLLCRLPYIESYDKERYLFTTSDDETLEGLGGAQLFTTLALRSSYCGTWRQGQNNITTKLGLYRFVCMPLGLTNAPSIF